MRLEVMGHVIRATRVDEKIYISVTDLINSIRAELGMETLQRCKAPADLRTVKTVVIREGEDEGVSLNMIVGMLEANRAIKDVIQAKGGKKKDTVIGTALLASLQKAIKGEGISHGNDN